MSRLLQLWLHVLTLRMELSAWVREHEEDMPMISYHVHVEPFSGEQLTLFA